MFKVPNSKVQGNTANKLEVVHHGPGGYPVTSFHGQILPSQIASQYSQMASQYSQMASQYSQSDISVDCRPTVGRLSVDYRPIYRSTIGQQLTDIRQIVPRYIGRLSTDASAVM